MSENIRLYPNKLYVPALCINSYGELEGRDKYKLSYSDYYEYKHYTLAEAKSFLRGHVNPVTHTFQFKGFKIQLGPLISFGGYYRFIFAMRVIKREDFNAGIDVTDSKNWYYLYNPNCGVDRGLFKLYAKAIGIDKKRIIEVNENIERMFCGYKPQSLDDYSQEVMETRASEFLALEKSRCLIEETQ